MKPKVIVILYAYDLEIDRTFRRLIRSPRNSKVANNSHNGSAFAYVSAILKSDNTYFDSDLANSDFDSDLANSDFDFGLDTSKFSLYNMTYNNRTLKELATPDIMCQPWCIRYPKLEQAQSSELKFGLIHLFRMLHGLRTIGWTVADLLLEEEAKPWVSSVKVVRKKSGMTVMKNQNNKFVSTRVQNILERLAGYMQIHIALADQHKTTFTYPFGTFSYTRMSFECCMEVFMDGFMVYDASFDPCLENRCIEINLVLNFEKCHFMGIYVYRGIEVDKAKIDIISSLSLPACVWEVRSFLGHVAHYPCHYLSFENKMWTLSLSLVLPFELMCDVSNLALGGILGQQVGKRSQANYTTTEKEILAIVFALDKTRSYLLGFKIIIFSNHATLKFLLKKPDVEPRFEILVENLVADHLSKIDPLSIRDDFSDECILDHEI
ncbi:Retrovirus-related Pol polyprotein from transposon opus, partial [Mucuna pruriens]